MNAQPATKGGAGAPPARFHGNHNGQAPSSPHHWAPPPPRGAGEGEGAGPEALSRSARKCRPAPTSGHLCGDVTGAGGKGSHPEPTTLCSSERTLARPFRQSGLPCARMGPVPTGCSIPPGDTEILFAASPRAPQLRESRSCLRSLSICPEEQTAMQWPVPRDSDTRGALRSGEGGPRDSVTRASTEEWGTRLRSRERGP